MVYADYDYYLNNYAGTLVSSGDFFRLSRQASAYIDTVTCGNAEGATDGKVIAKLSDACCAVAELLCEQEQRGDIASESNDGTSITYVTNTKTVHQRMYDVLSMYLGSTGLLYTGVM